MVSLLSSSVCASAVCSDFGPSSATHYSPSMKVLDVQYHFDSEPSRPLSSLLPHPTSIHYCSRPTATAQSAVDGGAGSSKSVRPASGPASASSARDPWNPWTLNSWKVPAVVPGLPSRDSNHAPSCTKHSDESRRPCRHSSDTDLYDMPVKSTVSNSDSARPATSAPANRENCSSKQPERSSRAAPSSSRPSAATAGAATGPRRSRITTFQVFADGEEMWGLSDDLDYYFDDSDDDEVDYGFDDEGSEAGDSHLSDSSDSIDDFLYGFDPAFDDDSVVADCPYDKAKATAIANPFERVRSEGTPLVGGGNGDGAEVVADDASVRAEMGSPEEEKECGPFTLPAQFNDAESVVPDHEVESAEKDHSTGDSESGSTEAMVVDLGPSCPDGPTACPSQSIDRQCSPEAAPAPVHEGDHDSGAESDSGESDSDSESDSEVSSSASDSGSDSGSVPSLSIPQVSSPTFSPPSPSRPSGLRADGVAPSSPSLKRSFRLMDGNTDEFSTLVADIESRLLAVSGSCRPGPVRADSVASLCLETPEATPTKELAPAVVDASPSFVPSGIQFSVEGEDGQKMVPLITTEVTTRISSVDDEGELSAEPAQKRVRVDSVPRQDGDRLPSWGRYIGQLAVPTLTGIVIGSLGTFFGLATMTLPDVMDTV